jgi:hypothetical protein
MTSLVASHTTAPLELPDPEHPFSRADLVFYGLDHSGPSYEARVFLDAPQADRDTPRTDPACAGSFYMFGHGGCFGDPGHCEVPAGPRDPFDLRPPHQLVPAVRILTITPALKAILAAGRREMTVTVVAHSADERRPDVLTYETVRLLTYAD